MMLARSAPASATDVASPARSEWAAKSVGSSPARLTARCFSYDFAATLRFHSFDH